MDDDILGYQYVHITNDYMFAYVMQDEKLCIALLETLLPGHKIERLVYYEDGLHAVPIKPSTQKALFAAADKRSVRLDVYLDDGKTVYNVEMQTTDTPSLPQRSRMYQSHLAVNQLLRGANFDELRPSFVIFLCTFDPFGRGWYRYAFQNRCDDDSELCLQDGAYTIFYNTKGLSESINPQIRELFRYMNDGDYRSENADSGLVHALREAVERANRDDDWRRDFMTFEAKQRDAELRGETRGRAMGRREGRAEGRSEGRTEERREFVRRLMADHMPLDLISRYTGLTPEAIQALEN